MKSSLKSPFHHFQLLFFFLVIAGLWFLFVEVFHNTERNQWDMLLSGGFFIFLTALLGIIAAGRHEQMRRQSQARLADREKSQREMIERLPIGYFRLTMDGVVVDVNEALVQILRLPGREDALNKNATEFYLDPAKPRSWIQEIAQNEEMANFFSQVRLNTGDDIWVRINARVIKDRHQKPIAIEGTVEDFDAHLKAETALRHTQAQLSAIFNTSPLSFVFYDRNFRILAFNQNAETWVRAMTGRRIEQGEVVFACIDPRLLEDFGTNTERALRGERISTEKFFLDTDHQGTWLQTSFLRVDDDYGNLMGVLFSVHDITARKTAEEQLQKINEQHARLLETTPVGIAYVNSSGKIVYVNSTAEQILHTPKEELCRQTIDDLAERITVLDGGEIPFQDNPFPEVIRHGNTIMGVEHAFLHADGTRSILLTNAAPLRGSNGAITGMVAAFADVTEQKEDRQQLQLQLQRIASLRSIDRAVTTHRAIDDIIQQILQQTREQLAVDAAALLLMEPDQQYLRYTAGFGFGESFTSGRVVAVQVFSAGATADDLGVYRTNGAENLAARLKQTAPGYEDAFVEYIGVPLIVRDKVIGVFEIFKRQPASSGDDWIEYLITLAGQLAIALDSNQLHQDLQTSNQELTAAYESTLVGWSKALEMRDRETEGHSKRVTEMTVWLAQELGVGEHELNPIRWGALLHDIGKLGIPDNILLKPGPLTPEEWVIMQRHPTDAYNLLSSIPYLGSALDIPYCHHERWDGSGYPRKLKGEEIPLAARIFAVVDVWDALSSDRPYRKAWPEEQIVQYLRENRGILFDPQVVDRFLGLKGSAPTLPVRFFRPNRHKPPETR